jgi:hypothetical protein
MSARLGGELEEQAAVERLTDFDAKALRALTEQGRGCKGAVLIPALVEQDETLSRDRESEGALAVCLEGHHHELLSLRRGLRLVSGAFGDFPDVHVQKWLPQGARSEEAQCRLELIPRNPSG